jgi:ABC-type transport system involved in multi-copper enzyme maturation permease subunit
VIRATMRTIIGRKGSFYGGALVLLAGVLIAIAVVIVVHELRPGRNPSMGGRNLLDATGGVAFLVGTVVAILIGALAGSYDAAQGTMRYLVMTGARRGQIYAVRTFALVLSVWLALLPSVLLGSLAALLLPQEAEDKIGLREIGALLWSMGLLFAVFALISMGIGAVLRSNGAAIAISLVFALGFTPLLALIDSVSHTVGDLMLPNLIDRLTGGDDGAPIPVAAVGLVVWVGVFWAAGRLRVQRDEY